ncbi:class I SAM-dependent methyltransferase [Solitalea longa]|uniref:Class I SAM-dependent methyltransferase n=1 Tax=Solitalea longa TaxID=2079460 RepID=A0A2S5AAB3_9SPHI|nr:class I SAM-dependent methyltransferase [Solitalea longa]POY39209.1 class I SAM-dependent methyltransferase [Solitalea longa]
MDPYKITSETYNKIANLYQQKFMDLDLYNETYDTFCRRVEQKKAAILEIGCGPGNITRYLLSQRPDFNLTGIDVAPNMIALAQDNNPSASFKVMDCREIHLLEQQFQAIICGFCIPYLSKEDCQKLITDCAGLLNKNGILYLSFVEDDYEKSGFESNSAGDKIYFHYHQQDYLLQYLTENQFKIENRLYIDYPKADGSTQVHTIFIARKVEPA